MVEAHNIPNQAYDFLDIGNAKVEALKNHLLCINPDIVAVPMKTPYSEKTQLRSDYDYPKLLISCVDSIEARQSIVAKLQEEFNGNGGMDDFIHPPPRVIDARTGGGQLELYSFVDRADLVIGIIDDEGDPMFTYYDKWKESIPKENSSDPCTARSICYTSMGVGAFIANQVKRIAMNQELHNPLLFHFDTMEIL